MAIDSSKSGDGANRRPVSSTPAPSAAPARPARPAPTGDRGPSRTTDRDRDRDDRLEDRRGGGPGKRPLLNREIYDRFNPGKMTLLIDPEGEKLGMFKVTEAITKAEELGLDLVQVNPDPMVCRIQDYNKEEFKRRKDKSHNKAKRTMLKELQVGLRINRHDLDIKLKHAREFLDEGHRVQFTMRFFGREVHHAELGMKVLDDINKEMEPFAKAEVLPRRDNARSAILVLAPKPGGKKKGGGGGEAKSNESSRKKAEDKPAAKSADTGAGSSLGNLVEAAKTDKAPK